jgi:hypothetical protein
MIEKRYNVSELRLKEDSRTIIGTCIVFNSLSQDLGGFKEIIHPDSITQSFLDSQDIVMLYNHEQNSGILARSKFGKGTLTLNVTNFGVNFSFECKNTSLGNEVYESIKNGDLESCSFSFVVGKDEIKRVNNEVIRTIYSFKNIYDCSIVVHPAYKETNIDLRKLESFRCNELKQYFHELRLKYNTKQ